MSSEIIRATMNGIHTVFHFRLADFADVITGAMIRATTAGRIPMKMEEITLLFLIMSGVRKIAMKRIMRKEGRMVPREAMTLPFHPFILSPTDVARFTANIPGRDCDMARRSRKSFLSIQWCLSTISLSMMEIMAQPPPNVKRPILKNVEKRFQRELLLSVADVIVVLMKGGPHPSGAGRR